MGHYIEVEPKDNRCSNYNSPRYSW